MNKVRDFLEDFWYDHEEKIKMSLKIGVVGISIFMFVYVVFFFDADEQGGAVELDRNYSELDYYVSDEMGINDVYKTIVMEDPFMSSSQVEAFAEQVIENEKEKHKVHRMTLRLYTRELLYEKNIGPSVEVLYYHEDGWYETTLRGDGWFDSWFYRNYVTEVSGSMLTEYGGLDLLSDENYGYVIEIHRYRLLEGYPNLDYVVKKYVDDKYGEDLEQQEKRDLRSKYRDYYSNVSRMGGLPELIVSEEEFRDHHGEGYENYMQ